MIISFFFWASVEMGFSLRPTHLVLRPVSLFFSLPKTQETGTSTSNSLTVQRNLILVYRLSFKSWSSCKTSISKGCFQWRQWRSRPRKCCRRWWIVARRNRRRNKVRVWGSTICNIFTSCSYRSVRNPIIWIVLKLSGTSWIRKVPVNSEFLISYLP